MSASYPSSIKSFTNPVSGNTLNSPPHATQHADENDEIVAIQTELGTVPKGTYSDVKTRLDGIPALVLPLVYPIGCIYTSIVSTNPATVFGFGTWTAFAAGKCLVGLDGTQTEFNTVQQTGGEKTHTLTVSEMPSHTHTFDAGGPPGATTGLYSGSINTTHTTNSTGGDGAHNNLQPYIVVYFFKRTA